MATENEMEKLAGTITDIIKVPGELGKGALWLAALAGIAGGSGLGFLSSRIKEKDPKLTSLDRKKKYYDGKIEEMKNENWLNDLMATKRKLDTARLDDDTRAELEKKYVELINR